MRQGGTHVLKLGQFLVDLGKMLLGQLFHIGTGPAFILVKRQQSAAILDGKAQGTGAAQKRQLVIVAFAKGPIAIGVAQRVDQADILVITDGLGRQSGTFGNNSDIHLGLLIPPGWAVAHNPGLVRRRFRARQGASAAAAARC